MASMEDHLMTGETIVYRTRRHPAVLLKRFSFLVASVSVVLLASWYFHKPWISWLSLLPAAVSLPGFLDYISAEFVITDRRMLIKSGWHTTQTRETLLNKLGMVSMVQSVGGRIFGYGTVVVVGPGSSTEVLDQLRDPVRFSREIQQQMVKGDSKPIVIEEQAAVSASADASS